MSVKDKVEFLAIDDISLLIKTEEEVDAEAEDSAVANTLEMGTRPKSRSCRPPGIAKVGIDVSKWQKEIDWDKVKNEGVEFAIIRCGYRGSVTGSLVEDPYSEQNMKGARAAGITVGVYFFTQAVNEVEAVEEATAVISLVRDYELQYPVFIDTEGAGGNGSADSLNAEERTAVCEAFCTTVENAGSGWRVCMPAVTGTTISLQPAHWSPTPSGLRSTAVCPYIRAIIRSGSILPRVKSTVLTAMWI